MIIIFLWLVRLGNLNLSINHRHVADSFDQWFSTFRRIIQLFIWNRRFTNKVDLKIFFYLSSMKYFEKKGVLLKYGERAKKWSQVHDFMLKCIGCRNDGASKVIYFHLKVCNKIYIILFVRVQSRWCLHTPKRLPQGPVLGWTVVELQPQCPPLYWIADDGICSLFFPNITTSAQCLKIA